MTKKKQPDNNHLSFSDLAPKVKRIQSNKVILKKPSQQTTNLPPKPKPPEYQPNPYAKPIAADETLFFSRPHLASKTLNRLRQGKLAITARLDLHGMTWSQAQESLQGFFTNLRRGSQQTVLIIPGKGAILKTQLNAWLRQRNDVLAFCSASLKHGGTGALYILIKA